MNSLLDRSIASDENVFNSDDIAMMSDNSYESINETRRLPAVRTSYRFRRAALMELVEVSTQDDVRG